MVRGSNNVEYHLHQVDLPADVGAAGQRVGAINEMAHGGVSAELLAHVSGHDFEKLPTMWYYLHPSVALIIPGALVLLGWPSLPYGQLDRSSTPSSLAALCDGGFVSLDALNDLTDKVMNLRAGFTSPKLLGTGSLRPFAHAIVATLIMNYKQSVVAGEAPKVTALMRQAMTALRLATDGSDADAKLKKWGETWGEAVKTTFDADNLQLTSCASAGGHEQIANCVQQLGRSLGEVQVKLGASTAAVKANAALGGRLNSYGAALATRGLASPSNSPSKKACVATDANGAPLLAGDADAIGAHAGATLLRPGAPLALAGAAPSTDAARADAARAGGAAVSLAGAVSLTGVVPSAGAASLSSADAAPVGPGAAGEGASVTRTGAGAGAARAAPTLKYYPGAAGGATLELKGLQASDYYEIQLTGAAQCSRGATCNALAPSRSCTPASSAACCTATRLLGARPQGPSRRGRS
ncbi:hypothetical protein M885DRAFT_529319 [Pelagophyceae sp. CCMP2097]|nr:hypothetical protein M885DRAFT_529319 [Pelagophyceae sp. CCMP2097]